MYIPLSNSVCVRIYNHKYKCICVVALYSLFCYNKSSKFPYYIYKLE